MPISSGFGRGYTSSYRHHSDDPQNVIRVYDIKSTPRVEPVPIIPNNLDDNKNITYEIYETDRRQNDAIVHQKAPINNNKIKPVTTRYVVEKRPVVEKIDYPPEEYQRTRVYTNEKPNKKKDSGCCRNASFFEIYLNEISL